jgi:hypothetical protein
MNPVFDVTLDTDVLDEDGKLRWRVFGTHRSIPVKKYPFLPRFKVELSGTVHTDANLVIQIVYENEGTLGGVVLEAQGTAMLSIRKIVNDIVTKGAFNEPVLFFNVDGNPNFHGKIRIAGDPVTIRGKPVIVIPKFLVAERKLWTAALARAADEDQSAAVELAQVLSGPDEYGSRMVFSTYQLLNGAKLPAWSFMCHPELTTTSPGYLVHSYDVAHRRMSLLKSDESLPQYTASLAAVAGTLYPTSKSYSPDIEVGVYTSSDGRCAVSDEQSICERFGSVRLENGGDCEDGAREFMLHATATRAAAGSLPAGSHAARAGAVLARDYAVCTALIETGAPKVVHGKPMVSRSCHMAGVLFKKSAFLGMLTGSSLDRAGSTRVDHTAFIIAEGTNMVIPGNVAPENPGPEIASTGALATVSSHLITPMVLDESKPHPFYKKILQIFTPDMRRESGGAVRFVVQSKTPHETTMSRYGSSITSMASGDAVLLPVGRVSDEIFAASRQFVWDMVPPDPPLAPPPDPVLTASSWSTSSSRAIRAPVRGMVAMDTGVWARTRGSVDTSGIREVRDDITDDTSNTLLLFE